MVIWKITVGTELNDKRVLGLGITFHEYSPTLGISKLRK
jgi:hypothetical protein